MATIEYEVHPLFAVPYFMADIGSAISDTQIDYIKNLKVIRDHDNMISENLYILQDSKLANINTAVQDVLDVYANEVMGIKQKLYVTQSWSLINSPNARMQGHPRSNSIISGWMYYCGLPDPVSNVVFERHNSYQQLELIPQVEKRNVYNTLANSVTPEKNKIILFPSGLQHRVEVNKTGEPRYSIAFNCFIKGRLGNYRDVSELSLD
jgi:uncharacterized protein (TIGR02466 family)